MEEYRSSSAFELQTRGLELYRQKQYEHALRCFTQAINKDEGGASTIIILDNRAATHSKLKNLRAALSDGQKMIRLAKNTCTGYLRTGQILQLMGKDETARDIYEMGMAKVPPGDVQTTLLQQVYKRLLRRIATPEAHDPFQVLPPEIVGMIMSLLNFHEVCCCIRVSTPWHKFLDSMPSLWTNLDFPRNKRPPKLPTIRKYVHRAHKLVHRVVLPGADVSGEGTLRYITSRCTGLQELIVPRGIAGGSFLNTILCAGNLKILIVGPDCHVTSDWASQVLDGCKLLEQAEFGRLGFGRNAGQSGGFRLHSKDFGKLQSLVMKTASTNSLETWDGIDIKMLASRFPDLITLTLRCWNSQRMHLSGPKGSDFSGFSKLKTLDISGLELNRPLRLPPSIVSLDFPDVCGSEPPDVENKPFEHLARLSIRNCQGFSFPALWKMLQGNLGNLTSFNATKNIMSRNSLTELIQRGCFRKVEELILEYCDVTDDTVMSLAKHTTALRSLNLACTRVTGAGLRPLLEASDNDVTRKLEYLCLDRCTSCSLDAVEWARSMGIRVSFNFPDLKRGGRKIRSVR